MDELQGRVTQKVKDGMVKGGRWAWPTVQKEGVAYCTAAQREVLQENSCHRQVSADVLWKGGGRARARSGL